MRLIELVRRRTAEVLPQSQRNAGQFQAAASAARIAHPFVSISSREVFAASAWDALRSTYLEPPLAAVIGDELGVGSTPTDAALVAALATGEAQR